MTLDPKSSPESIRKQAKAWLKALRAGDAQARARLAAALPDAPAEPGLRHVQHALARELGFPGWTALQEALADLALARKSEAELAEILLRSAWQGDPAFIAACTAGNLSEARRLAGANPHFLKSPAALILATQQGNAPAVALLLELGMDPDSAPNDGKRALHWAAQNGHVAVAEALIAAGSDVDRRGSPYDATPLGFAIHFGQMAMVDLLAPLSRDIFGLAAIARLARMETLLKEDPALADARNPRGETPLFALPDEQDLAAEAARTLLAHGADPRAVANNETPETAAKRRGLDEAAELIREAVR